MADTKISDLAALATPANNDLAVVVDVSDATMDPSGTDKKMTVANLRGDPALGGVLGGTVSAATFAVDMATQAELDAHTGDTSDAHDASAISFAPAGSVAATDVQAAIVEVDGDVTAHVGDPSAAHAASAISFSPSGSIAATTVQAAIEEVAAEAGGGGASDLDGLTDVVITAAASGDIIRHNGSNWVDVIGTSFFEAAGGIATHAALTATHGVSGALVGTTDSQTLTNKTLTTPTLTLKQSTTPTPTAEGDLQWDSDDNRMVVGDGATTKTFSDDSVNRARANHTGTQLAATISDFNSAASGASAAGAATVGGDLTGTVANAQIAAGAIVNADVSASAAIAVSKTALVAGNGLGLSTDTLSVNVDDTGIEINADTLRLKDGGVTSAKIADGTIVNADVNASAAIALSKLATDPLARANHTGTQTASTISDFDEAVDDRVGVLVVGGTGITATYNDAGGTHTIATTITQYTDEMARDALGTALTAGSGITITPNDGADTITIAASGGGGSFDPSAADHVVSARMFSR